MFWQVGGMAPLSFYIVASAAPFFAEKVLSNLCKSPDQCSALTFTGYAKAKKPGAIETSKIRSIVPLPSIIRVIDQEVAHRFNGLAEWLVSGTSEGFYEAARKGRQVLDCVASAKLAYRAGPRWS